MKDYTAFAWLDWQLHIIRCASCHGFHLMITYDDQPDPEPCEAGVKLYKAFVSALESEAAIIGNWNDNFAARMKGGQS